MSGLKKLVLAFSLVLALNATSSAQLMIGIGGGNPYGYSNGVIGGRGYGYPGYGQGYGYNQGYGYGQGYGYNQGYGYGAPGYTQQQTTIYPGGTTYYNSGYRGYAPTVVGPSPIYSMVSPYTTYYRTPSYGYRSRFGGGFRGGRRW